MNTNEEQVTPTGSQEQDTATAVESTAIAVEETKEDAPAEPLTGEKVGESSDDATTETTVTEDQVAS